MICCYGKGDAGKTTISAIPARLFGRDCYNAVAVDMIQIAVKIPRDVTDKEFILFDE